MVTQHWHHNRIQPGPFERLQRRSPGERPPGESRLPGGAANPIPPGLNHPCRHAEEKPPVSMPIKSVCDSGPSQSCFTLTRCKQQIL